MPPMPLVTATPRRYGSSSREPASARAPRAAAGRARDLPGRLVAPLMGEAAHAAGSREHRRPGGRDITAERRGRAEPSDDDAYLTVVAHCNLRTCVRFNDG